MNVMRIILSMFMMSLLLAGPVQAMDQQWIDDLNQRFPGIGYEFHAAVQQKLKQHGGNLSAAELLKQLLASPNYQPDQISDAQTFGLHSELMLLYPAVGNYQDALHEAKLLRDFVINYSSHDPRVVQTFRGAYTELLIINEKYEQALEESNATIALNPAEEGNYLSRGIIRVKLGQLDQALEDLKVLLQTPETDQYAKQLFVFLLENRTTFQKAQVQRNSMIDMMVRELEPESGSQITIPAVAKEEAAAQASPQVSVEAEAGPAEETQPAPTPSPVPEEAAENTAPAPETNDATTAPLEQLLAHNADSIAQVLGAPLTESDGDTTFDRDYSYQGHTLTIGFEKSSHRILSFQMFFLPVVDEATAFKQIGLTHRSLQPSMSSELLKVWKPYGNFSKVRVSLNEGQVIAIIVEP